MTGGPVRGIALGGLLPLEPDPSPPAKPREQALLLLVCGDRSWISESKIRKTLLWYDRRHTNGQQRGIAMIHGGASGADRIAGVVGQELGWTVRVFPADWATHGKAAGPIRNRQMLDPAAGPGPRVPLAPRVQQGHGRLRPRGQAAPHPCPYHHVIPAPGGVPGSPGAIHYPGALGGPYRWRQWPV